MRLGIVSYLAARPCVDGLVTNPLFDVTEGTPSELVDLLHSQRVDCALVSSIEGFRRPGYRFVPNVCIGADGSVRSVLLFSQKPLRECKTLALDAASRSGSALAQICLRALGNTQFQIVDSADALADARVRIGDNALVEAWSLNINNPDKIQIHDLAQLWKQQTGLPFVFAVWLVRPGVEFTKQHAVELLKARERGCAARRRIAADASAKLGIPADDLFEYLTLSCRYDLTAPGMMDGLFTFRRLASEAGLADPAADLRSV
ncbi:MAG: menaquinone biosynthetic enzyme MqnA/MqnD family protein [Planctomycetota bacterium]